MKWTQKEFIIFLAGAEAFHTLAHLYIALVGTLPIQFGGITITPQLNMFALIINAIITVGLLWWAQTMKK
ncbi:MAG TPA: hypothetical protein PLU71_03465 [Candidatus Dependentiae bacterium]|nr:hypothetical protein [Candidatus Dependentiae bacterium]HRQ62891.1 hypothetical protein [Candidatus Dependentiae bacterium]